MGGCGRFQAKGSNMNAAVKQERNSEDPELTNQIGGGFSNLDAIKEARPNFLKEIYIRDANGKRPEDQGYDETSLFIPEECWNSFTPAMI